VGSTTHYIWQASQVIAEHNGTNGAVLTDYIYSGSRTIAKVSGGTTQYFLSDRLSTRLVLDTSGNVLGHQAHLPFGEDFGQSGPQEKHHFTSYDRDSETASDYAVNRQYAQSVARFMAPDRYRASAYRADPQSWNRYSYTRNNPINRVDRLGLGDCPDGYIYVPPPENKCVPEYEDGGNVDGGTVYAGPPDPIAPNPFSGPGPLAPGTMGGEAMEMVGPPPNKQPGPDPDPLSDLLNMLKRFWNLNPCEKAVAMNTPFPFLEGILEAEAIAQKVAKVYGDNDNDYGNAVKHCTWSCEMARRTNQYWAEQWGTAHECDKKGRKDRDKSALMDLHNNEVGRELAKKPESEGSCTALCARSKDLQTSP
jgi:RHS repeat-associated protein